MQDLDLDVSRGFTSSGWTASCAARVDLATGSDHHPVLTKLRPPQPLDKRTEERPLNFKRTDWQRFASLVAMRQDELDATQAAVVQAGTVEEEQAALDAAFESLQQLIGRALQETTPRCKGSERGCQFWDADCDAQLSEVRAKELALAQARATGIGERAAREQHRAASKCFERQLKKSKRAFFDARLEELSGNSIWAAMKWSKGGKRRDNSPPLLGEDGIAHVAGLEKMALLREVLLAPPPPTNQTLPDLHHPSPATLPDSALRKDELRAALFAQAQDKAAGPDGIPFRALRAAWPGLEDRLHVLFARALAIGWHPRTFRKATLVALPKGGKRDLSQPRSYRLIALLPTLGKVLEKIVAARLAELGLQHGWIAAEQFGNVPGRSTSDAALTLVHDVEAGWTHAKPLITSALACDVRGAYDAVHYILLICSLYERGVPLHLLRWILSFLLERKASIRLDGEEGEMESVEVGIPQGSPVSPILYILFAASLHRLFGPQARDRDLRRVRLIGYVDDNLFYITSADAADNARVLAKAYGEALRWASSNGLRFDADKKEFIQFVAPRFSLPVEDKLDLPDGEVAAVAPQASFRWLGIHFDSRLRFTEHVEKMVASAKRAASGMAMLMNTRKGMRVVYSRRLYIACIRSRLCYAAEVWWRGMERWEPGRPHTRRRRGSDGRLRLPPPDPGSYKENTEATAHARRLDSAQHAALLRALPVYKTTSRAAVQQEAACPPMDLVLDHRLDQAALRLARMDKHHPLRVRVAITSAEVTGKAVPRDETPSRAIPPAVKLCSRRDAVGRPFSTRLTALARRVPRNIEPCSGDMARGSAGLLASHPKVVIEGPADWALEGAGSGKDQEALSGSIQVYTDGSLLENEERVTGAGWVLCKDGTIIERHHHCTGRSYEVFDAEAEALMHGTVRALQLAAQLHARTITVFVDNQSVLQSLRSTTASSSSLTFAVISYHVQAFLDVATTTQIAFRWVRGHSDVPGNEAADEEAKLGAEKGLANGTAANSRAVTFATAARLNRERLQANWQTRWRLERDKLQASGAALPLYARACSTPPHLRPSSLHASLSRREYALVLHLRTGHGDFSEYHERFKHDDANTECICGDVFTRLHPLRCPAYARWFPLLLDDEGEPLSDSELLGSKSGVGYLIRYARASKAFSAHRTRASLEARAA